MAQYFSEDKTRKQKRSVKPQYLALSLILFVSATLFLFSELGDQSITGFAVINNTRTLAGDAGDNDTTTYYFDSTNQQTEVISYSSADPIFGVEANPSDFGDIGGGHDIYIRTERGFLDTQIDDYLSDLGWVAEEQNLTDTSSAWINNLTPYKTVFIDYERGRFKLPSAPLIPDYGTGNIEYLQYVDGCKIAWPDNTISGVNITADGMLDGKYVRLEYSGQPFAEYFIIDDSSTTAPWLSNADQYSSITLHSINQTTGSTSGFNSCNPITTTNLITTKAFPIYDEWSNDVDTVQVTYREYEDREGPEQPVVWQIGDSVNRTTDQTIQVYGYTGEKNSTVHIDVLQNYTPFNYRNYTQGTSYTPQVVRTTNLAENVTETDKVFFIDDTSPSILESLSHYNYITFPGYPTIAGSYFTINGTPQPTTRTYQQTTVVNGSNVTVQVTANVTRIRVYESIPYNVTNGSSVALMDVNLPRKKTDATVDQYNIGYGTKTVFLSNYSAHLLTYPNTYNYLSFADYEKEHYLYYTINGTPQRVGDYIRLQVLEPIEDAIPIGAEVTLHSADRPVGWFNKTIELFTDVSKVFIYAKDYLGNQGRTFVKYIYYYPETMDIAASRPVDGTTFNNINKLNFIYNVTSSDFDLFACDLYLNGQNVHSVPSVLNGSTINTSVGNLTVGNYYWHVECFDDHLAASEEYTFSIIDTIAPIIQKGFNRFQRSGNMTLDFNISDLMGVSVADTAVELTTLINGTTETVVSYDYLSPELICVGGTFSQECQVTFSNLTGTEYTLSITAKDVEDQEITDVTQIIIDDSDPTISEIRSEQIPYTTSKDILANWTCVDQVSGIRQSRYAIGTELNTTLIRNWTTIETNSTAGSYVFIINETNLSLNDRTDYYIYAECQNNAETTSDLERSITILFIDITAPDQPIVLDEGTFTSSNTLLFFEWMSQDEESGIHHYDIQLGQVGTPGSVFNWRDVGPSNRANLTGVFPDGNNYSLQVRAIGTSGQISTIGESNGIIIDGTPPINGSIDYRERSNTQINTISYDVGTDPISFVKNATLHVYKSELVNDQNLDTCSGDFLEIDQFLVNTSNDAVNVSLMDGCYRFRLKVNNYADLQTVYSIPKILRLDNTPPENIIIFDDAVWTSNHTLSMRFRAIDNETHITNYTFALGSGQVNRSDMYPWTTIPADITQLYTHITLPEENLTRPLENGQIYYLSVMATNNASLTSERYFSDGVVWVDKDVPVTVLQSFEGEPAQNTSQIYYDTDNDTFTSIVVATENDTVCKIYDQDVHYQQESGFACTLVPPSDILRDCVIYLPYDGFYTRHISCKDQLNNQQTAENNLDLSFYVDGTPPEIIPATPQPNTFVSGTIPLSANITDEGIGIVDKAWFSFVNDNNITLVTDNLTNSSNVTYQGSFDINGSVSDGSYDLEIYATDKANLTGKTTIPLLVDRNSPTISLDSPNISSINSDFVIDITITDRLVRNARYAFTQDSTDIEIIADEQFNAQNGSVHFTQNINISALQDGLYRLSIEADDYNNHSIREDNYLFVDRTPPQLQEFNSTPQPAYATQDIEIRAEWFDNDRLEEITITHDAINATSQTITFDPQQNQTAQGSLIIGKEHLQTFTNVTYTTCAQDYAGNTACSSNQTITILNQPAQVFPSTPTDYIIREEEILEIDLNSVFFDPEGDNLTFTIDNVTNSYSIMTNLTNTTLKIQPVNEWSGRSYITMGAEDQFSSVPTYLTIEIIVEQINDAPYLINQEPVTVVTDNTSLESFINISTYFRDPEENEMSFTFEEPYEEITIERVQLNNDQFYSITRSNGTLFGRYPYNVTVSDGNKSNTYQGMVIYLNDTTIDVRDLRVKNNIEKQGTPVDIELTYLPTYPITLATFTVQPPLNGTSITQTIPVNASLYNYNTITTTFMNTTIKGTYQVTTTLADTAGEQMVTNTTFSVVEPITQYITLE